MRISVFFYISLFIISSTKFSGEKSHSLSKNLVRTDSIRTDINLIVEEKTVIQFDKSLEYTQTQRPYLSHLLNAPLEFKTNTLKKKKVLLKIATNPLKPSSLIVTFPLQ